MLLGKSTNSNKTDDWHRKFIERIVFNYQPYVSYSLYTAWCKQARKYKTDQETVFAHQFNYSIHNDLNVIDLN